MLRTRNPEDATPGGSGVQAEGFGGVSAHPHDLGPGRQEVLTLTVVTMVSASIAMKLVITYSP